MTKPKPPYVTRISPSARYELFETTTTSLLHDNVMSAKALPPMLDSNASPRQSGSSSSNGGHSKGDVCSIHVALVARPRVRLFIQPLLWTPQHLSLLRVSVRRLVSWPAEFDHRSQCSLCSSVDGYDAGLVRLMRKSPASRAGLMAVLIHMASHPMINPDDK